MIPSTDRAQATCHQHFALFYADDPELCRGTARHLSRALRAGGVAIAVATPAHAEAFQAQLETEGIDVRAEIADGRLLFRDAADALASFSSVPGIDPEAFRTSIGGLVEAAAGRGGPVHIYGEMVAILWDAGDVLGAIELEELWNDLGEQIEFSLMCGYRQSAVSLPEQAEAVQRVCHLHSAVHNPPADPHAARDRDRAYEVAAEFAPVAESPSAARRLVSEVLEKRVPDRPVLHEDASLLVSELVSNAVLHARSPLSVVIGCDSDSVRIAVHDFSSLPFAADGRGANTGLGIGLQLVATLADDWGIEPTADGKTVWARLKVPGPHERSSSGSR